VNNWKIVNSKGLKGIFDAGQSSSLPRRFENQMNDMCHKPVSLDDPEIANFTMIQPQSPSSIDGAVTICTRVDETLFGQRQGADLSIEQWLSRVKLETCSDDDFEVISIENPSQNFHSSSEKPGVVMISNSSETKYDLSKWLKPKVKPIVLNTIVPEKLFILPSTTASKCAAAYTHNPLKNRFVDFPCLREDPATWISPKRRRPSSNTLVDPELSFYTKPNGIVPSEYFNLPATFWLKKTC